MVFAVIQSRISFVLKDGGQIHVSFHFGSETLGFNKTDVITQIFKRIKFLKDIGVLTEKSNLYLIEILQIEINFSIGSS